MSSIEVRNVSKFYGNGGNKKKVLDGLNMSVRPGSIYSLIGASGCGKTTLLSCILGMRKLDSGTIKVLGHDVVYGKSSVVTQLIGYMPQDIALVPELTIREILYYFGNIFQMDQKYLKSRFEMVMELLELPCEHSQIRHLSGGQQRRVSIAVSIIHNPLILILDEPTVGLDSVLRHKIWSFLLNATRNSQLSIVITTHYISEAAQADRCGFMRDGAIKVEGTTESIMARFNATNLDEAFLNLCLIKTSVDQECQRTENIQYYCLEEEKTGEYTDISETTVPHVNRKIFNAQTMAALFRKELIRFHRQPGTYFFTMILLPICTVLFGIYAVGGDPKGLRIGIVNREVTNHSECSIYLGQNLSYLDDDGECAIRGYASCHFLNEIHDEELQKIVYDSCEAAVRDTMKGKIVGFIKILQNLSQILLNRSEDDDDLLKVQLDQSQYMSTDFTKKRLYSAYERFNLEVNFGCGKHKKISLTPLNFDETFYGSLKDDMKGTVIAPLCIQILISLAFAFPSFCVAGSKIEGVWNRTLLTGVKTSEIMAVPLFLSVIANIILCIGAAAIVAITKVGKHNGNPYLILFLVFLACCSGSMTAVALSSMTKNLTIIFYSAAALCLVQCFLNGVSWPIEGQPQLLQYFSVCLPVTLPSRAIVNISSKGVGLADPSVINGISSSFLWIFVSIFITLYMLKKHKFTV